MPLLQMYVGGRGGGKGRGKERRRERATEVSLLYFTQILRDIPNLTSLDLSQCYQIGEDAFLQLADDELHLEIASNLLHLDLSNCGVTDKTVKHLSELGLARSLRVLFPLPSPSPLPPLSLPSFTFSFHLSTRSSFISSLLFSLILIPSYLSLIMY